jgi:hypothetical protein
MSASSDEPLFEVVGEAVYDAETDSLAPAPHDVYECWVSGHTDVGIAGGFTKRTDIADIALWVAGVLPHLGKHAHVHIVKHRSDEYVPVNSVRV